MATKNPRVAAYLPPRVYKLLVEFKRYQGLKSDSAAMVAIIETYLCDSSLGSTPSELSSTSKRMEYLELKVSSLLCDVAVLKQAMSQYTCQVSGEELSHNQFLHQPDNYEALSEPPNKSPNTTLDLTNESVVTSASTSISELQKTGTDSVTQLVESSVRETASTNGELSNESLLVKPTAESILNNPPVQAHTVSYSELPCEPLDDKPLAEENNHPEVSSSNSEPLSDKISSSLEKSESKNFLEAPSHLTGAALARRLNVSSSTLRHKKNARNFAQWTSVHDPDGIAWHFDGEKFIKKTSPGIQ